MSDWSETPDLDLVDYFTFAAGLRPDKFPSEKRKVEEFRRRLDAALRASAREAFDRMLDGCIAFLVERGHRELAAEMRARIMEHPEMQGPPATPHRDAVAGAKEAVLKAAKEWHDLPPGKSILLVDKELKRACAALAQEIHEQGMKS